MTEPPLDEALCVEDLGVRSRPDQRELRVMFVISGQMKTKVCSVNDGLPVVLVKSAGPKLDSVRAGTSNLKASVDNF